MSHVGETADIDSRCLIGPQLVSVVLESARSHCGKTGTQDGLDHIVELWAGLHIRLRPLTLEQPSDTDLNIASGELFPARHGPLPEPEEPTRPGVAGDVIGRDRSSSQDEPAGLGSAVNRAPDQIP